ncbi:MAG: hypothetical protein IJS54_07930 [Desulfovibrio sp.]|nr:hypothetical protein [Desulfovibrio sp.]
MVFANWLRKRRINAAFFVPIAESKAYAEDKGRTVAGCCEKEIPKNDKDVVFGVERREISDKNGRKRKRAGKRGGKVTKRAERRGIIGFAERFCSSGRISAS